jgi:hypothetical protein
MSISFHSGKLPRSNTPRGAQRQRDIDGNFGNDAPAAKPAEGEKQA